MLRKTTKHLFQVMTALFLASCATNAHYLRSSDNGKAVEAYSSADSDSALSGKHLASLTESAIASLKDKIKENAHDPKLFLQLANLQLMNGQVDQAEKNCRQALNLDLKNKEAKITLAQIYFRRNQYEMTKIILNAFGEEAEQNSRILNMQALIALHENSPELAMGLFKKALQLDPQSVATRMNLGVLYLKYREINAAATQFERVLKLMPDHYDAKLHMAIIAVARNKPNEAEKLYDELISNGEINPLAYYNLAILQLSRKAYKASLKNLERYITYANADADKLAQVAKLSDEIQDYISAEKIEHSDDQIKKLASTLQKRAQEKPKMQVEEKKNQIDAKVVVKLAPEKGEDAPSQPSARKVSKDEIQSLEEKLEL